MAQAAPTLGAGPRPQLQETKTPAAVLKTLAASAIILKLMVLTDMYEQKTWQASTMALVLR
jgi:hypothetical protein